MPNSPVRTAVLVPVLICIDIRTDYRSCMKTKRTDLARDDGGTSKAMIYDERFVLKTFRTVHNFVLIIILLQCQRPNQYIPGFRAQRSGEKFPMCSTDLVSY